MLVTLISIVQRHTRLLMFGCVTLSLVWTGLAFATPPVSKYTPGETLDPSCSPGDTNCAVTVPLQSSSNLSDLGSVSTARSNLGLVINSDVQGYSAALASIGGLTTSANTMIYATASNTYATTDLTSVARTLLGKTTTGAMATYLRAVTPIYTGDVSITGVMTANSFIGDGSQLSGVTVNDGSITSTKISNGTIANIDVSNSAAIDFSKLSISASDIRGLSPYVAGTGLSLTSGTFSITSSVVTSNYGGSVVLAGSVSPYSIAASTSDSGIPNTMTNTSSNATAGVLKLTLSNIANPSSTNHYIDFYSDAGSIGSIRGDGAGGTQMSWVQGNPSAFNNAPGLQFVSIGADYAEYLEREKHDEVVRPGDIVGVKEGKISLSTDGADRAMVVSARPVVVGNQPAGNVENFNVVAFVGQVVVRVIGPVHSGDFIVASGRGDGVGLSKAKDELTPDDLVVGQAWENVSVGGKTYVKIGIVPAPVIMATKGQLTDLQSQIDDLRAEVESLRSIVHE